MSDAKPKGPNPDELAKELKASLAQRRPRPWKTILAALAVSIANLAFFAWWLYPRPTPTGFQVFALDAFSTDREDLTLRAQLLAAPGDAPRSLRGHKVIFHEPPALLQRADKPEESTVFSDEQGQAQADWTMPKTASADFQASFVDPNTKPAKHTDSGRIFVRPAQTPVLLVDADETLRGDVVAEPAAAKLTQAAKDGWQVVYLSLSADKLEDFRKARERLLRQPLPRGPILGRWHAPGADSAEAARRALLGSIKQRFQGPLQALVSSPAAAEISKETVPTILIGDGVAPAGVLRVASWNDLLLRLK